MEPSLDLGKATFETFAVWLDQDFGVAATSDGPDQTIFRLVSSKSVGPLQEGFRQPFSLVFRGPIELPLAQQTVWLSHPDTGRFAVMVVPISQQPDGRLYEAIFS